MKTPVNADVREQVLRELTDVYPRVLARAVFHARDPRVRSVLGGTIAQVTEELVHHVVMKTLRGQRRWDPNAVSLEQFLVGAVRSFANACRRKSRKPNEEFDEAETLDLTQEDQADLLERKRLNEALECQLIEAAGDDAALLDLTQALLDGAETASDLAADSGCSQAEAEVRFKKLRRRVRKMAQSQRDPKVLQ